MRFVYPVDLVPQEDGSVLVRFPDVRGAVTEGSSAGEALIEAVDCLVAALGGYMEKHEKIPSPSRQKRGQAVVNLPPLVSAKLALYQAMRDSGLSNVSMARRLSISEGAVRRLLDLDHRSHIGHVEAALTSLGKRLVVEVRDAA